MQLIIFCLKISSEEKKARQEQFLEWMADHWYRAKEWTNEDDQIRFVGFFQQTLRELKKFGLLGEHGLTLYEKKRQGGHQPQLPDQSDISQVQQQYLQKKNQDTPKVSSTFFTSTIFWLLILIFVGFNLLIWVYIHQGNNDQFQDLSTVKQPRKRKKRKKTLRVKTRKNSISRTLNRTRNKIKKPRKSNEQFSWKDS